MGLIRTLPLVALAALTVVAGSGCRKRTVKVLPNEIPQTETTTPSPPPAGTEPTPGTPPPPTSPTTPVPSNPQSSRLRVIHAVPDAPGVDFHVNDKTSLSKVTYKSVSSYVAVPGGPASAKVTPTGSTEVVIGPIPLALEPGQDHTLVGIGAADDDTVRTLLLSDDNTAPAAGKAKIRVVHAASDAPPIDVLLDDRVAVSNLGFGKSTGVYTQLDARTYAVKLAPTNGQAAVLGPLPFALRAGKTYTLVVMGRIGDRTVNVQVYTDN